MGGLSLLIVFMGHMLTLEMVCLKEQRLGQDLPGQKKTVRGRFECRHLQRFFVQHEFPPILHWSILLIWRGAGADGIDFRDEAMRREHIILFQDLQSTSEEGIANTSNMTRIVSQDRCRVCYILADMDWSIYSRWYI